MPVHTPVIHTTIRHILERPHFQEAVVIGDEASLNRTVTWVHIIEVTKLDELLNGNELVLTTGVGWYENEELSLSFLKQLIHNNVSGLCIELGTYTPSLPASMIEYARNHHFPLILFHEKVRYIDITQDLHSLFIHQHYQMVKELEDLSSSFNHILLNGKGIEEILYEFHRRTKIHVYYLPIQGDSYFYPALSLAEQEKRVKEWVEHKTWHQQSLHTSRPIMVLTHYFADLIAYKDGLAFSEFDELAFDRCATAIAQEVMRTTYMEERRRQQEERWMHDWINNENNQEEVSSELQQLQKGTFHSMAVALISKNHLLPSHKNREGLFIQKSMLARSVFEERGVTLLATSMPHAYVFILLYPGSLQASIFRERLYSGYQSLVKEDQRGTFPFFEHLVFGKTVKAAGDVPISYQTAKETEKVKSRVPSLALPFYENLHLFRTVLKMEEEGDLEDFIDEHLGELLRFDEDRQGQLIQTLKVYLQCFGSKQDAAKELYVVRQTLYHRLDKISELMGDDLFSSPKRLPVELALHAYEYQAGTM